MKVSPRHLLSIPILTLALSHVLAKDLPTVDASAPDGSAGRAPFSPSAASQSPIGPGAKVQIDARFGVPAFLWPAMPVAGTPASAADRTRAPEQAARRHLSEYGSQYRLDRQDIQTASLGSVHNTGRGAIIVTFHQTLDGIEVFRDEIKVAMNQKRELIAISGYIPGRAAPGAGRGKPGFKLDAAEAIARALEDYDGTPGTADAHVDPRDLRITGEARGGYEYFDLSEELQTRFGAGEPCRVRKVFFHLADGLEPAYYIELDLGAQGGVDSDHYAYVISAADGRLLFRKNLTVSDSYSYRVWADTSGLRAPFDGPQGTAPTPHPTGLPDGYQAPFVPPNLVTLQNGPISTNDPWLSPGATQTVGNNVDAYADLVSPDGLSAGDSRAFTTGAGAFDRVYDTTQSAESSAFQRSASVTQLFYDVNFFHDWYYDSGFDEASGNAQGTNYGRGGLESDSIKAEAQDYGGRNNANMSTPADGARPRMQMYVFDGIGPRSLTVASPPAVAGPYAVGTASFGPQTFNTTGDVVLVDDGSTAGTGGTITDGCQTPFVNAAAVSGKVAFIDRGVCAFTVKVKNAQLNGAIGVILANNTGTSFIGMTGTDATITIPSLSTSQADGSTIRAQLGAGVNATLSRTAAISHDGTIDNQIVAHEWGHYISNRLIGDASGLSNNQGGGMGEGWGDFHALLLTVRPEDAAAAGGPNFSGVYSIGGYVRSGGDNGPLPNNGYYFSIRRVPYSTDFSKDPLTFKHIANGVPLPAAVPIAFGADGSNNAEVHNTGEVWTTMLWECYASLLRDTARLSFDQARDRMRDYLVAAYKLTPNAPTFLEGRDALLAAVYANNPTDYLLFAQAFARRGAGLHAVGPDRFSNSNQGVVESFDVGKELALFTTSLEDGLASCDEDGILDNAEWGELTVNLKNTGNGPLSATTATVVSANPSVSFPGGGEISFPISQPFGATSGSIAVRLSGAVGVQQLDLTIHITDPELSDPGGLTVDFSRWGNADDLEGQSATDDVESEHPRSTPMGNPLLGPSLRWRRLAVTGIDHRWYGPDVDGISDQYLVSPFLNVAATGAFSFTFRHRYSFEDSPADHYDGGVIELSTNGGTSWTDIGAFASPGYTGAISTCCGNPLQTRNAYIGTSPGYPGFGTVTVDLGTAYQGQSVRIRFRIATDEAVDAPGWEIDDIAFNNINNLPFSALVPDAGLCTDADGDGFSDSIDCAPFDSTLWSAPLEARNLTLSGSGSTNLAWTGPLNPGGSGLVYDVLRSTTASSFAAATCIESNDADRGAADSQIPATIFYYLVRSETACGETLGVRSDGTPRTGVNCP